MNTDLYSEKLDDDLDILQHSSNPVQDHVILSVFTHDQLDGILIELSNGVDVEDPGALQLYVVSEFIDFVYDKMMDRIATACLFDDIDEQIAKFEVDVRALEEEYGVRIPRQGDIGFAPLGSTGEVGSDGSLVLVNGDSGEVAGENFESDDNEDAESDGEESGDSSESDDDDPEDWFDAPETSSAVASVLYRQSQELSFQVAVRCVLELRSVLRQT